MTTEVTKKDQRVGEAFDPNDPSDLKPPCKIAAVVGGIVFALYALTLAPTTAFLVPSPAANWAPPVETWIMPSQRFSENARSTALAVTIEETLIAG